MSDTKEIIDGGGLLKGSDGKPSLRRWGALVSFVTAIGFMAWGMAAIVKVNALALIHLIYFSPALAFIAMALILIGFINKQNIELIKSLITKDKP